MMLTRGMNSMECLTAEYERMGCRAIRAMFSRETKH